MSTRIELTPGSAPQTVARKIKPLFLSEFQSISPRYRTSQAALLNWLTDAHVRAGGVTRESVAALFARYSASEDKVATRGHELADFSLRRPEEMRLFGPTGSDLAQKTEFFQERVNQAFERFYPTEQNNPGAIIHVTCTGYCSPSGAQRIVSLREWGRRTEVLHAYHMGCYAAHPAIRMAMGMAGPEKTVDIVHSELCSLHLDPTNHDPAQLIIQSLFADGFIKYRAANSAPRGTASLEVLAARDEIIPDSMDAMRWVTGPMTFTMTLSREVPTLFASALPRFAASLLEAAGLDWNTEKSKAVFAVHPGGPRIIELSERILNLQPAQVRWSRHVLKECGNMSSATLPHIWQLIIEDKAIPAGSLVVSLGAGPGLTLSGVLFRKV